MAYEPLAKLYYTDKEYEKIYAQRYNSENAIHIDFEVSGFPAFFVLDNSLFSKSVDIYKTDKRIKVLRDSLPKKAISQFTMRCLIDEIILTNDIEGVYSSRREINGILSELETKSRGKRYMGLVQKYLMLQNDDKMSFETCNDIRVLYDDLVYFEIAEDNPDNLPDGEIFRKDSASVVSATQKELHRGVYPENKIIAYMDKALHILNDESIDFLFRVSIFHFLFGYIHPFYDGNGRTSRFISSYLLSKEFESIIAYRISYTVKENIKEYYQAFKTCNNPNNKGDLTPFILMFTDIIRESLHQLEGALKKRNEQLSHYKKCIPSLPYGTNPKYVQIYYLLIQASLFSENGISTGELIDATNNSRTTVANRLKEISDNNLIIKESVGNVRCYRLNLNTVDEIYNQNVI